VLEAIAKAAGLIMLIFAHRAVDWALTTAFSTSGFKTYHQWVEAGTYVGFSAVYVMLLFDIGVLFWPFRTGLTSPNQPA
jgi:hypothetical protein